VLKSENNGYEIFETTGRGKREEPHIGTSVSDLPSRYPKKIYCRRYVWY
jgi:hypothetical protein